MRVLVVSGIWPPDVGGPASHAPDVAEFLQAAGHRVEVVITAAEAPAPRRYRVGWTSRRLPVGVRHAHSLALIAWRARHVDAVYTTGMFARCGIAAIVARRPFVMKLTGDPAFERLQARGVVAGDIDAFQQSRGGGPSTRALRRLRDWVVRRADHVFTPSSYLRDLVISWGVAPARVSVMPNPAPAARPSAPRAELRERFGLVGETLAFAGRLTAQKSLEVMLAAVAARPGRHPARRGRRGGAGRARRRDLAPRPRRPRAAARAGVARRGARRLRGGRRLDPLVELGELPAQRGRVARRRDAGDRHEGRRGGGGRPGRRQRPPRPRR